MRYLLAFLLLVWAGSVGAAPVTKAATYRIEFSNGTFCSATAVSAHTLLTAEHCFVGTGTLNKVGTKSVLQIGLPMLDGKDHALVRVSSPFPAWATIGPQPAQGQAVFIYGNPLGARDWMRQGVVVGVAGEARIYQMPTWGGDSGSGIFDSQGRLVGVVKGVPGADIGHGLTWFNGLTASVPIAFTREQWAKAFGP